MPRTELPKTSALHGSSLPIRPPPIMGPIIPTAQSAHPSFTQNIKDGFSLGVGLSVARNIVDRMFGNSPAVSHPQQKITSCEERMKEYDNCLAIRQSFECLDLWKDVKKCLAEKKE